MGSSGGESWDQLVEAAETPEERDRLLKAFQAGQRGGVQAVRQAQTEGAPAAKPSWKVRLAEARQAKDDRLARQILDERWAEIERMQAAEEAKYILKNAGLTAADLKEAE